MAAIPDYVGNALQFDRSSRDTERMHDVQMQRMLQDLTQQATLFQQQQQQRRDQQQQLGQEALRYGDQSTQLSSAPAPSDNSFPQPPAPAPGAMANTSPYMGAPPIQAQSMPTPPPGQSSQPMQPPGGAGAPPNLASLLGPKGQSYLSQQPQNAQPAALQVLLENLMGKGATVRAPAPPGAGPAPAAPMQGPAPAPASGPAPTPNAATGGWQPSPGAGPALGGKPPVPAGAPASNALGAPPIGMGGIGGGSGMESRKIINPVQEIAKMVKDQHMTPDQAGRVGQAMLPVWEAQNKSVVDDFAKQSKIAAQVMHYQDMLLRESRLEKQGDARIDIQKDKESRLESGRSPGAQSGPAADSMGQAMTPETRDFYAAMAIGGDYSWRTGLSRTKNGSEMIRTVDNRVPSLAKEWGLSPGEIGTNKAKRVGLTTALRQRENFVTAGQQYVANLQSQADLVEKYMTAGAAGGVPAINRWIQSGRKSLAGDPDVVALDTAIRGLAREHQRIVTGVTSNAQLHVAAQQTADELLNKDMTIPQMKATIKVMREEAANAIAAGKGELGSIEDQITALVGPKAGANNAPSSTSPASSKVVNWNDLK